ncbi:MAG TPA: DedA family protein [Anaerolineae bacterium]|nr:DedA family protein [Anaerolineae bacterium]
MSIFDLVANTVISVIDMFGYWAIFGAMFLESACIPIPSEVVMPFSGFASSNGVLSFWTIVVVGTIGQLLGSITTYYIGRSGGRHLVEKYGKYVLISKRDIRKADEWFERRGDATVLFTRMVPVVRTFISLPAGISRMNFAKFVIYSTIGIIPWTLLLTYVGVKMGENWDRIRDIFHGFDLVIGVVLVVMIFVYLKTHLKHVMDQG